MPHLRVIEAHEPEAVQAARSVVGNGYLPELTLAAGPGRWRSFFDLK